MMTSARDPKQGEESRQESILEEQPRRAINLEKQSRVAVQESNPLEQSKKSTRGEPYTGAISEIDPEERSS